MPAYASRFMAGEEVRITSDEVIDEGLVVVADEVNIEGMIDGDLTAVAGRVQIDGTVRGDVVVTAGSFSLNGEVDGSIWVVAVSSTVDGTARRSVRLWGNSIESDGEIEGNLLVLGNIVSLGESSSIGKDVLVAGRNIEIGGKIGRELSGIAWQAIIESVVGKDVELEAWRVGLRPGATIEGELRYISSRRISFAEESAVRGRIEYLPLNQGRVWNWTRTYYRGLKGLASSPILKVGTSLSMLLVGASLIFFSPMNVLTVSDLILKRPFWSLLMGVAFLVATPVAVFFFFILVVGIPAGSILLAIYLIAIYVSRVFVGVAVGRGMLKLFRVEVGASRRWQVLAFVLGLVALNGSTYIPYAGSWLIALYVILGLGALEINFREGGMLW
jgi:cytoskeletal protein CcmA (bactofilin family)